MQTYFPKLDSVRAFAAFAVVFAHIFQIWTWDDAVVALFPLGDTGITVFFVLSGFLITALLLAEPDATPLRAAFQNFYLRRTLRIFPIYYLYLSIAFALNLDDIRATGGWTWAYLTNFFIFQQDTWLLGNSHLWTLSVEEQFYLVCPCIVLLLRQRPQVLLGVFLLVGLAALSSRGILFASGYSDKQISVFTIANLDSLALGGLLALLRRRYGARINRYGIPLLLGGCGAHFLLVLYAGTPASAYWVLDKFFISVAALGLVLYSIGSRDRVTPLHNPLTAHLGKISYGIYLYHNPMVEHYSAIAAAAGIHPGDSVVAKVIICLVLTLACAELSYALIERPLLRWKNRWGHRAPRAI